jgi:hypothetical protein
MRLSLAIVLMAQAVVANAKQIQFDCVLPDKVTALDVQLEKQRRELEASRRPGDVELAKILKMPPHERWEYSFLIDDQILKGVENGTNLGGTRYALDVEVTFTPERMEIKRFNDRDYIGWIDRQDLTINYGGATGTCKMAVVKPKRKNKF